MPLPEHVRESAEMRWFMEEVQPLEPALRAYLRGAFPSIEDTDDLIQESYFRILRAASDGHVRQVKPFLFATARHVALDIFRRRKIVSIEPMEEIDGPLVLEDGPGVRDTVNRNQELQLLTEAIQALPDRTRQVITLRKLYSLPQKEIAAQLGISEHTVEAHVVKGMQRCTEYFRKRGLP